MMPPAARGAVLDTGDCYGLCRCVGWGQLSGSGLVERASGFRRWEMLHPLSGRSEGVLCQGRFQCRAAHAGMVNLTTTPCRCPISRISGPLAPYMVNSPEHEWIRSFRPGLRTQ